MTVDLPEGWDVAEMGTLIEVTSGKFITRSEYSPDPDKPYPVAGAGGPIGWTDQCNFYPPIMTLGRVGAAGALNIYHTAAWVTDNVLIVKPEDERLFDWSRLFFSTVDWADLHTGSSQPLITQKTVKNLSTPLPPLAEQKRIVAKVEELLARVNAARDRLEKVPKIMKRFRQSVLAAACSGKLTEDWREKNPGVEGASELLGYIELERSSNKTSGYAKPEIVENSELPETPDSWIWVRFGSVIGELRNGISTKPNPDPPGNLILRISSVRAGQVLLDEARYLPESDHLVQTYCLADRDLLFTRYNGSIDLLGVCGMVRGLGSQGCLYPDKLMRVRFDHQWILPEYAEAFFGEPAARDRMTQKSKSSAGQQGISGKDVKNQPFALPPIEEQHEIVRRVEALFKLADAIEKRVAAATARTDKLTQAILAKAFRGELVPTEAELARQEGRDYEPASVLLERIRGELPLTPSFRKRGKRQSRRGR